MHEFHDFLAYGLYGTIVLPFTIAALICVWFFVEQRYSERFVGGAAVGTVAACLTVSVVAALSFVLTDGIEAGAVGAPLLPEVAPLVVDSLSLSLLLCAHIVTLVVAVFSKTYLHKENGYLRYFSLLLLFLGGFDLLILAGSFNLLIAGWELIGISSVMLIGFFHFRAQPVAHGFYAFTVYHLCDVGLFAAAVMWPVMTGSHHLPLWKDPVVAGGGSTVILGLACLFAASGKSALVPWSPWLPRAMEGPTPSSAIFYGALSVHAGPYLLLRLWPQIGTETVAAIVLILGLATAVYSTLMGRTRADVKTQLAFATLSQLGLIFAEIALGFHTLALIHMVGNIFLRTYQFLCSPSALYFWHKWGKQATSTPRRATADASIAMTWEKWLYRQGLREFHLARLLDTGARQVGAFATKLADADSRFLNLCTGNVESTQEAERPLRIDTDWSLPPVSYLPQPSFKERAMSMRQTGNMANKPLNIRAAPPSSDRLAKPTRDVPNPHN